MITKNMKFCRDNGNKGIIYDFMDKYYDSTGRACACKVVKNINSGLKNYKDPLYYQDHTADSKNHMKSIALYLSEDPENPRHQLRIEYLSNKFIKALNDACENLGLPCYIEVDDADLEMDRVIEFDEPDYSDCSPECLEFHKEIDSMDSERWAEREREKEEFWVEADAYNRELLGDEYVDQMIAKRKKNEKDLFASCVVPTVTSVRVGIRSFATRGLKVV